MKRRRSSIIHLYSSIKGWVLSLKTKIWGREQMGAINQANASIILVERSKVMRTWFIQYHLIYLIIKSVSMKTVFHKLKSRHPEIKVAVAHLVLLVLALRAEFVIMLVYKFFHNLLRSGLSCHWLWLLPVRKRVDDRRKPVQWDHYQHKSGHVEAKDPNNHIYWNTNRQVLAANSCGVKRSIEIVIFRAEIRYQEVY